MRNVYLIFEKGNGYLLRIVTIFTAVLFHLALISSLIIIPLTGEQETPPLIKIEPVIVLPPAPPAGQPLGGGSKLPERKELKKGKGFYAAIPDTIVEGNEIEFEREGEGGPGVPWGSPGGVPGGVPWGVLFGSPTVNEIKRLESPQDLKPVFVNKPPRLLKKIEPVYPEIAIRSNIQGVVILEATTDINGIVQDIRVIKSTHPILEKSAIDAVRQWIYEPYLINGKPRAVIFLVTIQFILK